MFPPGPMVSFGSVCRISSYLVRAKLYPSERSISWRQYKKRTCEACTNVTETVIFSRIVTGETIEINHELNCDDKCFICLLKCKVCKNNMYEDNDTTFQRNEICRQQHVYEHFYSEVHNGFLRNVSINLIDKTDGFQPKNREYCWMRTLKTLASLGLNVESASWHFICFMHALLFYVCFIVLYMLYYCYFGLNCFWIWNFGHDCDFIFTFVYV